MHLSLFFIALLLATAATQNDCMGQKRIIRNGITYNSIQHWDGYLPLLDVTGPVDVKVLVYSSSSTIDTSIKPYIMNVDDTCSFSSFLNTSRSDVPFGHNTRGFSTFNLTVMAPTLLYMNYSARYYISNYLTDVEYYVSASTPSCNSSCSYNGVCYKDNCHCFEGWAGANCDQESCNFDCSGGFCVNMEYSNNDFCQCPVDKYGFFCQCSKSQLDFVSDITNNEVKGVTATPGNTTYYLNDRGHTFGYTISLRSASVNQLDLHQFALSPNDYSYTESCRLSTVITNYPIYTSRMSTSINILMNRYACRTPPNRKRDTVVVVTAANPVLYDLVVIPEPDSRFIRKLTPGVTTESISFPAPWFMNYSVDIPAANQNQVLTVTVTYSSPLSIDYTYGRIDIGNFSCVYDYSMVQAPYLTQDSQPPNVQRVTLQPPYTQDTYWIMVWLDPARNRDSVSKAISYTISASFGTGSGATTGVASTSPSSLSPSSSSSSSSPSSSSFSIPSAGTPSLLRILGSFILLLVLFF